MEITAGEMRYHPLMTAGTRGSLVPFVPWPAGAIRVILIHHQRVLSIGSRLHKRLSCS